MSPLRTWPDCFVVQLAPQLQLKLVHVGELPARGAARRGPDCRGKAARVQPLHLADQLLDLLCHIGVFLDGLAKLV